MPCGDDVNKVSFLDTQIGKGIDALKILFHWLVGIDQPIFIKLCFLERLFEFEFPCDFILVHDALLDQRGANFGNVAGIIDAVIMQFFDHAQFVVKVTVEFAAEAVRPFDGAQGKVFRKHKGEITSAAPDQLRFRQGGCADFCPACIARLITADNIKQVQHIPTLIEFLDGENGAYAVVPIFQRVDENLIFFLFGFIVHGQAIIFVEFLFQPFGKLLIVDLVFFKESKSALDNRDIRLADFGNLLCAQRFDNSMKVGFVFLRLGNGFLGFKQKHRFQVDSIFRRDFLFVLAENQCLKDAFIQIKVRVNQRHIF